MRLKGKRRPTVARTTNILGTKANANTEPLKHFGYTERFCKQCFFSFPARSRPSSVMQPDDDAILQHETLPSLPWPPRRRISVGFTKRREQQKFAESLQWGVVFILSVNYSAERSPLPRRTEEEIPRPFFALDGGWRHDPSEWRRRWWLAVPYATQRSSWHWTHVPPPSFLWETNKSHTQSAIFIRRLQRF